MTMPIIQLRFKLLCKRLKQPGGKGVEEFILAFEPHRYSRVKDCFAKFLHAFDASDVLMLTSLYEASEEPIEGASAEDLYEAINHPSKHFIGDLDNLEYELSRIVEPNDVVVFMGAGKIF